MFSAILLNPNVKSRTMAWMLGTQKEILSQLEVNHEGRNYKIVKIQNTKGLAVELYRVQDEEMTFLDSQQLTDKKDAFYNFGDGKYNLFMQDINEDGVADIILPSLDKNMRARLNVYSIDWVNEALRKQSQH
jgi:hypothetical protein